MKWSWIVTIALALSIGLNIGLMLRPKNTGGLPEPSIEPPPFVGPPDERESRQGRGEFARHHVERLAERLGLSEEERKKLRAVTEETMPRLFELRTTVQEKRAAIREAYRAENAAPAKIRNLVKELNRTQAALDSLAAEAMLREIEVLTPEQRRDYFRFLPWEGHRGNHAEKGRGRHSRR